MVTVSDKTGVPLSKEVNAQLFSHKFCRRGINLCRRRIVMLNLKFIDLESELINTLHCLSSEKNFSFYVLGSHPVINDLLMESKNLKIPIKLIDSIDKELADNLSCANYYPCYFLMETDPIALSDLLFQLLDLDRGVVVAPITDRYFKKNILFLISIPKSGTHLLTELVKSFGYGEGVVCKSTPQLGNWYCLEYSNTHTVARDFFVDKVRRSPFGLRNHPFTSSPALFIYRNPLDIVVSESNYYFQKGNTIYYEYLSELSPEKRLLKIIDDPWLLGNIRDRIGGFIPWLYFPNVIPISFEELIGSNGGGDNRIQSRLIWSLQLKLHIPGNPSEYGDQVFNRKSATFNAGRIGTYKKYFNKEIVKKFSSLDQDFMEELGYEPVSLEQGLPNEVKVPYRAEEFLRRPLSIKKISFEETPITIEYDFEGFNIIFFKKMFYAISCGLAIDLLLLSEKELSDLVSSSSIEILKHNILDSKPAVGIQREESKLLDLPPRLIENYKGYNIVFFKGKYFGLSQKLGSFQLEDHCNTNIEGIVEELTIERVKTAILNVTHK